MKPGLSWCSPAGPSHCPGKFRAPALALAFLASAAAAGAQEEDAVSPDPQVRVQQLEAELRGLRRQVEEQGERLDAREAEQDALLELLEEKEEAPAGGDRWYDRLTLGGYGEHHFNFREGSGGDVSDIHRFVMYVGYRFADWIRFHSETELEHGLVEDGQGELKLEQFHLEMDVHETLSVRTGRMLTPVGIINERHEPTTFYSVERPGVETIVIPTTWNIDGIGVDGRPIAGLHYELYVGSGLDGSGFNGLQGVRGGRNFERPSLNDPAVTGRVDFYPFVLADCETSQFLRTGGSFYYSGLDNGNNGSDPDVPGDFLLLSADAEYRIGDAELRGVYGFGRIGDARDLNEALRDPSGVDPGIGRDLLGWYVEAAYHLLPESVQHGLLEQADLVGFARYEEYDTQYDLPSNATPDPAADRRDIVVGLAMFLTPQVVVKTDFQFLFDDTHGRDNFFNVGFGYRF